MRDVLNVEMLRQQYRDSGFCVTPPVIPQELLDEANVAAEAVAAGQTDTGLPPKLRERERGNGPQQLVKIAEPHNSSHLLRRLVACPGIWQLAAAVTGARALQVWAVDLFIKRPTDEAPVANIGWHQDGPFAPYWRGDIFTVWVALSAVSADASPLRYVPGSQRLGPLGRTDLFQTDLDAAHIGLPLPDGFHWSEVTAEVAAGGIALHHRDMLHASGPNRSGEPRRSVAIRVRTDRCVMDRDADAARVAHLGDEALAPVVYGDARLFAKPGNRT
ncbi:phytanoyl-CoA dioxygenase family protein [Streptomyces sp. CA-135486]|uniref:phytanoyl-CoA dioxygenase family protein n=1 Tax=Streptomyces sp. CA-135486 TaxID=3240049 RepID=UPI003D89E0A9